MSEVSSLAESIVAGIERGDLEVFERLLAPQVQWGPPEGPSTCRNRDEVIAWYSRARAGRGRRASVTEIEIRGATVLVGIQVVDGAEGPASSRWQVLRLSDGLVSDIRGFDSREDALARLDPPDSGGA